MRKICVFALVLLVVATAVAFWSGGPTSLDELKQLITSNPFLLAICVATFIISVIVAPHLRSNCSSSTDESYVRLIKSVMPLAPKGTNCIIRGTRTYSKTQFTISCLESSDQSSPQNFLAQPAIKSSKPSLLDKVADLQPFSQGEDPSQDTFDSAPGSSADRSGTPSPRSGGLMDSELGTAETGKPQGCWSKLKNGIHGLCPCLMKPIGRLFSCLCKPIGRLFSFLWKAIGGLFSFLWKPIGGLFSYLWKPIHGLCPCFFDTIGRWMSCFMNTIGRWLSCLMNTVLCCRKPKFGDDNQNMDGSYNDYPSAGYKSIFVTPSSGSGTFPSLGKSSPGQFSSLNGQPTDGSQPDQGKSGPGLFSSPNGHPTSGSLPDQGKSGPGQFPLHNGQPSQGSYPDKGKSGPGLFSSPNGHPTDGSLPGQGKSGPGQFPLHNGQPSEGSYPDQGKSGPGLFSSPNGRLTDGSLPGQGKSGSGQFPLHNGQPSDGSHPDQGKSGPGQFSSPNGQPTDGNISEPLKKGISNFFNGQPDDVTGYHPGEVLNEGTVPGQSKYFQPYDSSQPGEFDDANQPGNSYDSAGKPNGASRRGYQRGKCFKQIIITAILSVAVTSATIFGAIFLYKKYSS